MTPYQSLLSEISAGHSIVMDGATGTELQRRGVPVPLEAWCSLATASHPGVLRSIHEDYINAGARLITANTFASTREILEPLGLGHRFADLNRQAVDIAVEARARCTSQQPILVAGSIAHVRPGRVDDWSPEHSDVKKFETDCTDMAAIHKAAGCDLILAEMMGEVEYSTAVIRAAKANGLPVWVGLSTRLAADGNLVTFANDQPPLADVLQPIIAAGGDVMGIMHTKSELIAPAIDLVKKHWSGPLMAYPDYIPYREKAGEAVNLDDTMEDDIFVDYCLQWQQVGVQILGGCCGLSVSHIAALNKRLSEK